MGFQLEREVTRGALVAMVGVVAIVVGAVLGASDRAAPTPSTDTRGASEPTIHIDVHVAGWVISPGVVQVREGAIVADAIEAAGGFRPGALTGAINLAAPVQAGDQIVVPGPAESGGVPEAIGDGLVAINRATASELETLPGVGPVLAERIVAHREQHGPFQTIEDLLDVTGIGEAKLASLRDLVRVP